MSFCFLLLLSHAPPTWNRQATFRAPRRGEGDLNCNFSSSQNTKPANSPHRMLFPRKHLDSLSRFQSRTRLSPSDVTAVCGAASLLFHFRCRGWQLAPTTGTNGARATESGRRAIHPSLYIHPSESSCVLVLLTIHASLALDESCELHSSVVFDDYTT